MKYVFLVDKNLFRQFIRRVEVHNYLEKNFGYLYFRMS